MYENKTEIALRTSKSKGKKSVMVKPTDDEDTLQNSDDPKVLITKNKVIVFMLVTA